jgi:hypothetical protein
MFLSGFMPVLTWKKSRQSSGAIYIELSVSESFKSIQEEDNNGELLKLEATLLDVDPTLLCEKVLGLASVDGPRTYITDSRSCVIAETEETMEYLTEIYRGIKEQGLDYFKKI